MLDSMRVAIAATLGATLMAWRGYEAAPVYSDVQVEMAGWVTAGGALLVAEFFWELLRWYQRVDRRHLPKRQRH